LPRGSNLRGLRRDLTLLRRDLLVLCPYLVLQHAGITLGLIELLRRGRLLREQTLRPFVIPARDGAAARSGRA